MTASALQGCGTSASKRAAFTTPTTACAAPGEYRWTSARAAPLFNTNGSIRERIGRNIDVTEQRRTEEAVRHSEQRLRLLLDSMQQKIFTTTASGNVDYFSKARLEIMAGIRHVPHRENQEKVVAMVKKLLDA